MANVTGPILITNLAWELGFRIVDAIFQANKLGGIEDPIQWWHWVLVWIVVVTAEVMAQRMIAAPAD
jgi:hypothetical protein